VIVLVFHVLSEWRLNNVIIHCNRAWGSTMQVEMYYSSTHENGTTSEHTKNRASIFSVLLIFLEALETDLDYCCATAYISNIFWFAYISGDTGDRLWPCLFSLSL